MSALIELIVGRWVATDRVTYRFWGADKRKRVGTLETPTSPDGNFMCDDCASFVHAIITLHCELVEDDFMAAAMMAVDEAAP